MFGFLKEKLNNFSEKLKKTISGKENEQKKELTQETTKETQKKEEPILQKEIKTKQETKVVHEEKKKKTKEEILKETEAKMLAEIEEEVKKEDENKLKEKIETKKEEPEKKIIQEYEKTSEEIQPEEETKEEQVQEKKEIPAKKGLLEKLFSFGKKEEKTKETFQEKKKQPTPVIKEQPKETKEKIETKEEKLKQLEEIKEEIKLKPEEKKEITQIEEQLEEESEEIDEVENEIEEQEKRMEDKRESLKDFDIKSASEDKRELKVKVGVSGKLSGLIFGGVEIKETEITDLLWELELSLLESDVEADTAHELVEQIKKRLIGQKVSAKNIDEFLNEQIKEILKEMMITEKINLISEIKSKKEKPYVILMLGPNGAGKTTSISKLTHLLKKNKLSSIWAAGDTFRAAAIDQLEEHGRRLGVRVIKHQYGADPAAVAFDAIKAAQAGKIDVVLIDSAGRQETNKNLMEELRKIERVTKPDLKLYVGEAYAGQGLLDQAKEFDEIIGINGFILTKIDTDAKGGTTISLLYKLKKPILYIGTGQEYEDFQEFSEEYIINRII